MALTFNSDSDFSIHDGVKCYNLSQNTESLFFANLYVASCVMNNKDIIPDLLSSSYEKYPVDKSILPSNLFFLDLYFEKTVSLKSDNLTYFNDLFKVSSSFGWDSDMCFNFENINTLNFINSSNRSLFSLNKKGLSSLIDDFVSFTLTRPALATEIKTLCNYITEFEK